MQIFHEALPLLPEFFGILLKAWPIIAGFFLTIVISNVLRDRTLKLAVSALLVPYLDEDKCKKLQRSWESDLEWFLKWRDLITAVETGIFVLGFSAAEQLDSKNTYVAGASRVAVIAFVPMMVLIGLSLAKRWDIRRIQSKYWFKFVVYTGIWYIISLVFIYSS